MKKVDFLTKFTQSQSSFHWLGVLAVGFFGLWVSLPESAKSACLFSSQKTIEINFWGRNALKTALFPDYWLKYPDFLGRSLLKISSIFGAKICWKSLQFLGGSLLKFSSIFGAKICWKSLQFLGRSLMKISSIFEAKICWKSLQFLVEVYWKTPQFWGQKSNKNKLLF